MLRWRKVAGSFLTALIVTSLLRCASNDVLEPVVETPPAEPNENAAAEVIATVPSPTPSATPASTTYQALAKQLENLGYEGVGLEFESETMLQLMVQVFSDPKVANRQIKAVYTGHKTVYESAAKSLTISKSSNPKTIISYIQKNIPINR